MPKTIDYPRTSYTGAWEVAEIVDDTGGKCAIDTCARKLNRKVSGSFKAIIGSAVKFGLVTSKRELLTTTNLFRRIKHAYDKQEEKIYHREAFLNPPLFTQICRKFRNRELPIHMFDVILIREFGVEEINAQTVSKAFVDGARMVGILDERNIVADIDQLAAQQAPRRELASTEMPLNAFKPPLAAAGVGTNALNNANDSGSVLPPDQSSPIVPTSLPPLASPSPTTNAGFVPPLRGRDAISSLFGLDTDDMDEDDTSSKPSSDAVITTPQAQSVSKELTSTSANTNITGETTTSVTNPPVRPSDRASTTAVTRSENLESNRTSTYSVHIVGPGIDSNLMIQDTDDLDIVNILLEKIRKQLNR
ncbi:hypothetical protein [Hymenobacter crusticola]|uniref:Uncharacterized protein n=1 Tax=Hymenobacter crusticola TaxID=1770526 RepID=A0A243WG93_9BACT|nr:hypothetical protein [Hymenobacter crusticola]OUJ74750.1 hypothetical protein BXP70_08305 [Hymenobacter crusticola]